MPIYYDSERHVIFTKCIDCGKIVEMPCSEEQWVRFELGGLIQNVFPDATPGQREAFVSGICDDCFENIFKAKKSRKSVKKTVNRKEDVHCQNCGSSNVELRQIAEFRSGSEPGSPLRSEHFRIICNDCGATTYDDVQYQASAKKSIGVKKTFEPKLKSFNTVVTEIRKKNNTKKV